MKGYPQLPGQWLQGRWPSRRQRRNLERNLNFRENSEDRKRRERSRPRGEDAGCKKNSLRRKEGGERKRSWGEVGRACQEKQQEKRLRKSVKRRKKKTKREREKERDGEDDAETKTHTEGERWRSLPQTGLGTATQGTGDRGTDTPRD